MYTVIKVVFQIDQIKVIHCVIKSYFPTYFLYGSLYLILYSTTSKYCGKKLNLFFNSLKWEWAAETGTGATKCKSCA